MLCTLLAMYGYQNTRAHDVITVIVVIKHTAWDDGCSKATSSLMDWRLSDEVMTLSGEEECSVAQILSKFTQPTTNDDIIMHSCAFSSPTKCW